MRKEWIDPVKRPVMDRAYIIKMVQCQQTNWQLMPGRGGTRYYLENDSVHSMKLWRFTNICCKANGVQRRIGNKELGYEPRGVPGFHFRQVLLGDYVIQLNLIEDGIYTIDISEIINFESDTQSCNIKLRARNLNGKWIRGEERIAPFKKLLEKIIYPRINMVYKAKEARSIW